MLLNKRDKQTHHCLPHGFPGKVTLRFFSCNVKLLLSNLIVWDDILTTGKLQNVVCNRHGHRQKCLAGVGEKKRET